MDDTDTPYKPECYFDVPWTEEELRELGEALDEILALENATP